MEKIYIYSAVGPFANARLRRKKLSIVRGIENEGREKRKQTHTPKERGEKVRETGGKKRGKRTEGKRRKERWLKRERRECEKEIFSDVARKSCSHARAQWKKSLTWMIAADQLVGREVSFSKSGFQFPKGAYRVPTPLTFVRKSASSLPSARAPFSRRSFLDIANNPPLKGEFRLPARIVSFHLVVSAISETNRNVPQLLFSESKSNSLNSP